MTAKKKYWCQSAEGQRAYKRRLNPNGKHSSRRITLKDEVLREQARRKSYRNAVFRRMLVKAFWYEGEGKVVILDKPFSFARGYMGW